MTQEEITRGRHLGDGVYASFDGYQIWLAVNHHDHKVVALDQGTFQQLVQYKNELDKYVAEVFK